MVELNASWNWVAVSVTSERVLEKTTMKTDWFVFPEKAAVSD